MKILSSALVMFAGVALLVLGCASGHCRPSYHIPKHQKIGAGTINSALAAHPNANQVAKDHVVVFKADGSRQCHPHSQLYTLGQIKAELTNKGIHVYSSWPGFDGRMHSAICDNPPLVHSPTGRGYLFEISKKDLNKAKSLGFSLPAD